MEKDLTEIKNTARLAKIKLSEQEEVLFSTQLASVLNWVEEIQKVDTSLLKEVKQNFVILRKDLPKDYEDTQVLRSAFNDKQDNFLKVKKVL